MKYFSWIVIAGLSIFFFFWFSQGNSNLSESPVLAGECKTLNAECQVNNSNKACCSGLVCTPFNAQSGNGKCDPIPVLSVTPTNSPIPVFTITPTMTPTGSISPTPTVTPTPCIELDDGSIFRITNNEVLPCVTPTVTPTPTPTNAPFVGTGVSDGRSDGRSDGQGGFNSPVCGIPTDKPLLQGFKRVTPTSVSLAWWAPVNGVDKYALTYGYYGESMSMGADNLPSSITNFTIEQLQPNRAINVVLWAFKNNCATLSDPIDP